MDLFIILVSIHWLIPLAYITNVKQESSNEWLLENQWI